jgi:hypothetical protein
MKILEKKLFSVAHMRKKLLSILRKNQIINRNPKTCEISILHAHCESINN